MIRASVVSPMIGDGLTTATAYRPRLFDVPGVISFEDVTGANPPVAPNYCVFECIFMPEQFDQLDPLDILWSVDDGNP